MKSCLCSSLLQNALSALPVSRMALLCGTDAVIRFVVRVQLKNRRVIVLVMITLLLFTNEELNRTKQKA